MLLLKIHRFFLHRVKPTLNALVYLWFSKLNTRRNPVFKFKTKKLVEKRNK